MQRVAVTPLTASPQITAGATPAASPSAGVVYLGRAVDIAFGALTWDANDHRLTSTCTMHQIGQAPKARDLTFLSLKAFKSLHPLQG